MLLLGQLWHPRKTDILLSPLNPIERFRVYDYLAKKELINSPGRNNQSARII